MAICVWTSFIALRVPERFPMLRDSFIIKLTVGGGRVPLLLLCADEHGEGRIGYMEALENTGED